MLRCKLWKQSNSENSVKVSFKKTTSFKILEKPFEFTKKDVRSFNKTWQEIKFSLVSPMLLEHFVKSCKKVTLTCTHTQSW